MTHSDLALDRLARLERAHDGPIPAPLLAWALSGAPALPGVAPAPAPATDHRAQAAAAFKEAKQHLAKAQRYAIHREWAVTRADKRYRTYLVQTCRQAARAYLGAWQQHRSAERAALPLAAE